MPEQVYVERRVEDGRGIQRFTTITFILFAILIDCKFDFELFGKESTPRHHKLLSREQLAGNNFLFFPFCPDGIGDNEGREA